MLRALASPSLVVLVAACAGARAQGPAATLEAYADALSTGDAEAAWQHLDDAARRGRQREQHAALMERNAAELRELGGTLAEAVGTDRVRTSARLRLGSGEEVRLVLEDGGWRVDGGVLDAAGLATPRDAVAALRRALMRRDLEGLERVLSRQTRAEWEEEVRRIVEATADPDDLEVEVQGTQARVRTTGGGVIVLVRESDEWHVVDVQPGSVGPGPGS
ncbi:MAG: hypothetical protein ACFCGT_16520 [Sandaracinaceae bacterium]